MVRVLRAVGTSTGVGAQPLEVAGAMAPDPVAPPPGPRRGSASDMDLGRDPGRVSVSDMVAVGLVVMDMGSELVLELRMALVAQILVLPQFLQKQRKNKHN
eukprot:TRINITY_DN1224_c2_g2_i1.p2 TRINITY_DN1224_c2_g2~~TRINITY_DN1224_c2_g2_i1.p2  ORF type:complete len:101 (-),score=18.31 TRINITY_DN1224_c2_g2_i1:277-579(-)